MKIKINEIFNSIQGEGVNVGKPSIFIRFSGCNLICDFCDTKHDKGQNLYFWEFLGKTKRIFETHKGDIRHLVLTGGEPSLWVYFLKYWFLESKSILIETFDSIEIETNGYVGFPWEFLDYKNIVVYITCSPKFKNIEYDIITIPNYLKNANVTMKPIVENINDVPEILMNLKKYFNFDKKSCIYLQPVNSDLSIARELIEKNCFGCNLSLQLQKILRIK